jgi:hypothetical protein
MCAARNDIKDGSEAETARGGLVYTKKAGWIDLGHARPGGAKKLWNKIRFEPASGNDKYYVVEYTEMMFFSERHIGTIGGAGVGKEFRVKRNLSLKEKKSVAMAIYFNISMQFETFQGICPLPKTRDSSFSGEDLVSNLVGFYRAVEPGKKYIEMCEPVSQKEARSIWDKYGPIGKYKNHKIRPLLFHLDTDGPVLGILPLFLRTIRPAKPGELYCNHLTNFDNRTFTIRFGGPD